MKNCVIIDIEKYDSMVEELKEYNKLLISYNKKVLENSQLIETIQRRDEEIEGLNNTIKDILNNIVSDDVFTYCKKIMQYDINANTNEYLNDNFIDLIKEIKEVRGTDD